MQLLPLSFRAFAFSAVIVVLPAMTVAPGAYAHQSLPVTGMRPADAGNVERAPRSSSDTPGERCDRESTRTSGAPACRRAAFEYLRAKGLSRGQAAGVVGNLWVESSGVSPKSRQFGGGPGRGIAQWTVDQRWQGVLRLARSREVSPEGLGVQLDYLWHELNSTYKGALAAIRSARNLREATLAFQNKFEVPIGTVIGGPAYHFNSHEDAHTADRVRYAREVRNGRSAAWRYTHRRA